MQGTSERGTGQHGPAPALRPVADAEDGWTVPLRPESSVRSAVGVPMGKACGCRICWLMGACGPIPADERPKVTVVPKPGDLFGDVA